MSFKLDRYDSQILSLLSSNARLSTSTIGRKIKLSRENVDYKIKRLIRSGIIKEFVTEFDEKILGLKHYVLFAQLIRLDGNKEEEILSYLKKHPYVSWIGTAAGKWTLIFDVYLPEKVQSSKIIQELFHKLGNHIEDYVLLEKSEGEYFFEKLTKDKGTSFHESFSSRRREKENRKIDNIDSQIMSLLNNDARINYATLSQKINLTANGIKKRIKSLELAGIIKKYSLSLNFKNLSYEWYGLQFKLTKFDPTFITCLKDYFKHDPQVVFYYHYLGQWDFDLGLIVKNSNELREFINQIRTKFPEGVKLVDVFVILEEVRGYQLPKGVFEL